MYDDPKYLPGGDKYLLVEFGNIMSLELNFKAQGLAKAIEQANIKGIYETLPCFASMIVHYNPDEINVMCKKTFGELYQNTQIKQKICKESGYKYYSIWESDWIRGKTTLIKLQRMYRKTHSLQLI